MYGLLIRLYLIAMLLQLGLTVSDLRDCRSGQACVWKLERAKHRVLRIDWKPIRVLD